MLLLAVFGKGFKCVIAHIVTEAIVDRFEMIEIEHHHGDRLTAFSLRRDQIFRSLRKPRRSNRPVMGSVIAAVFVQLNDCARPSVITITIKAVPTTQSSINSVNTGNQPDMLHRLAGQQRRRQDRRQENHAVQDRNDKQKFALSISVCGARAAARLPSVPRKAAMMIDDTITRAPSDSMISGI